MLSDIAMADIADMERQGIRLSPAEVVRLNELGLRISRCADAADVVACPRVGWAGSVAVHEPTLQVDEWAGTYAARFADDDDSYWSMYLFACCHATSSGFFSRPCMSDPSGIAEEIKKWRADCPATNAQLQAAFEYAYLGDDPGSDVAPVPSEKEIERKKEGLPPPPRPRVSDEMIAAGLSLSLDEMRMMTESRLYSILLKWYANKGYGAKPSTVRPHAEYIRTLAAIKAAHMPQPEPEAPQEAPHG